MRDVDEIRKQKSRQGYISRPIIKSCGICANKEHKTPVSFATCKIGGFPIRKNDYCVHDFKWKKIE